ncbi:hypothetical protein E4653_01090 [Corynebacterium diphtheriae subsp. lausannense]|nr:hypothetical protein E4653_01090 [Corynebacterium diphtheriae subsp. lausannense]
MRSAQPMAMRVVQAALCTIRAAATSYVIDMVRNSKDLRARDRADFAMIATMKQAETRIPSGRSIMLAHGCVDKN